MKKVETIEPRRRGFFQRALAGGVVTAATVSALGTHMALAIAIWGPWERGPL